MVGIVLAAFTACGGDDPVAPGGGGGGGGGGGATPVVTTNVTVSNNEFTPDFIQVSPGATVTWTWVAGAATRNVTFADASITDIPNQATGAHPSTMPTAAGDYSYLCSIHGGMTGNVRVQ
jgi:plastocyanin